MKHPAFVKKKLAYFASVSTHSSKSKHPYARRFDDDPTEIEYSDCFESEAARGRWLIAVIAQWECGSKAKYQCWENHEVTPTTCQID